VLTGLMAGAAADLRAELPAGAKVQGRGTGAGGAGRTLPLVVTEERAKVPAEGPAKAPAETPAGAPARTIVTADLGGADRIELAWSFPKIEGQTGSQVESLSYSSLEPDLSGYRVDRREHLRVTGRRVDAVEYAISGGLRLTEITGADVSEWSVLTDAGAPAKERLQVFFAKPVEEADLRIRGRAVLQGSGPLATLALAGAARQETFVAVRSAGRVRLDVPTGKEEAHKGRVRPLVPGAGRRGPRPH